MKITTYKPKYSNQVRQYNEKKNELVQKREMIEKHIKKHPEERDMYLEQLSALEIDYNAVICSIVVYDATRGAPSRSDSYARHTLKEKYDEYKAYLDQEIEGKNQEIQMEQAKKTAEGAAEYGREMSKIMMVARRMMKGDTVPLKDERKLSEYDKDLYKMAKNMQAMAQMMEKERKKHKSLWDDEEKKEEGGVEQIELDSPKCCIVVYDATRGAPSRSDSYARHTLENVAEEKLEDNLEDNLEETPE